MRGLVSTTLVAILLAGCAGGRVQTITEDFYVPEYKIGGSIVVLPAKQELNDSLEFAAYKAKIEGKLAEAGYTIAREPSEAEYVAFVSYGIDNGKSEISSTPIIGKTGGGFTSTSGSIFGSGGSTNYYGSSYSMPTYGVVGSSTESQTVYTRAVALDVVDARSLKDGHPKKVLEVRAKSSGTCSLIAGVFDEILEGMFEGFPGESGKVRSITVPWDGGC